MKHAGRNESAWLLKRALRAQSVRREPVFADQIFRSDPSVTRRSGEANGEDERTSRMCCISLILQNVQAGHLAVFVSCFGD